MASKKRKTSVFAALLLALTMGLAACDADDDDNNGGDDGATTTTTLVGTTLEP